MPRWGKINMHIPWRNSLAFTLMLLSDGVAANAQESGYFNRVATPGVRRNAVPLSSSGASVARSARPQGVARTSLPGDSHRPYSTQALAQIQTTAAGVPRHSTWQQAAQPEVIREVAPQPQARSYFPGMRASRAIQQPVTLTARFGGAPHICTPSRGQVISAGHHR
jgi:hypothetical protein